MLQQSYLPKSHSSLRDMLVEYLPSLEYPPISICVPLFCLYSSYSPVQPRPDYPLLFCREQVGCVGRLLLASQFGAVCSDPSRLTCVNSNITPISLPLVGFGL